MLDEASKIELDHKPLMFTEIVNLSQCVGAAIEYAKFLPADGGYTQKSALESIRSLYGRLKTVSKECLARIRVVLAGICAPPHSHTATLSDTDHLIAAVPDTLLHIARLEGSKDKLFEAAKAVEALWHQVAVALMSIELSVSNGTLTRGNALGKVMNLELRLRAVCDVRLASLERMLPKPASNSSGGA